TAASSEFDNDFFGSGVVSPWYGKRDDNKILRTINDQDGDGIKDADEDITLDKIVDAAESNPTVKDSDGDGYEDGVEVAMGSDPADDQSTPSPSHPLFAYANSQSDSDGDKFKDFYEVAVG